MGTVTMAEGGQGWLALEAAGDAPDGTLLQSGEVTYKGKEHYLHLLQTGLRLVAPQGRDKAGTTQASECVHLTISSLSLLLALVHYTTNLIKLKVKALASSYNKMCVQSLWMSA